MIERLHFLVMYVGSAAMMAFLAVCLSSPRVATFTCAASRANGVEQCELVEILVAAEAASADTSPGTPAPDTVSGMSVALAAEL